MGGICDAEFTAETQDEMLKAGWEHLQKAHPEMAKDIEAMPEDDPKVLEWRKSFDKAWSEAAVA